jgi:transcriptional regulator with XRE-family HTH domain
MIFGEYIQKLRLVKGLTLSQAARDLGMAPQRLCDIEQGRRTFKHPPLQLFRKLATLYEHPLSSLIENTEFFQYEKSIVSGLLSDMEPLIVKLEAKALEMYVEAKQYTPEMEAFAAENVSLTQSLKMALMLAKTRFSKAPKMKSDGSTPTKKVG